MHESNTGWRNSRVSVSVDVRPATKSADYFYRSAVVDYYYLPRNTLLMSIVEDNKHEQYDDGRHYIIIYVCLLCEIDIFRVAML